eukprot:395117_1
MSASVFRSASGVTAFSEKQTVLRSPSMSVTATREYTIGGGVADLGGLTRLDDKIRLLQEDLESERELRNRIERERADLSVQLISLTDRLEDAEGTTDAQPE